MITTTVDRTTGTGLYCPIGLVRVVDRLSITTHALILGFRRINSHENDIRVNFGGWKYHDPIRRLDRSIFVRRVESEVCSRTGDVARGPRERLRLMAPQSLGPNDDSGPTPNVALYSPPPVVSHYVRFQSQSLKISRLCMAARVNGEMRVTDRQ